MPPAEKHWTLEGTSKNKIIIEHNLKKRRRRQKIMNRNKQILTTYTTKAPHLFKQKMKRIKQIMIKMCKKTNSCKNRGREKHGKSSTDGKSEQEMNKKSSREEDDERPTATKPHMVSVSHHIVLSTSIRKKYQLNPDKKISMVIEEEGNEGAGPTIFMLVFIVAAIVGGYIAYKKFCNKSNEAGTTDVKKSHKSANDETLTNQSIDSEVLRPAKKLKKFKKRGKSRIKFSKMIVPKKKNEKEYVVKNFEPDKKGVMKKVKLKVKK
ncbi:hypothetical protein HELRODRAFT_183326 [Helobdella robusta]|uniref:Uncharacterized protein n=1 Tax=Helobdella robusta TaxID=6412 RepID=T1FJG6_HELRO|nr:hypothetical protein HELRODRAFT_183326 [Helobdella robusta]ESO11313.1 hypothetical protein HELRODRAFT_183326 [Helobdella robusta]